MDNVDLHNVFEKAELKNDEFSELLSKIKYASNETKKIWKEIYNNAIDDRTNAYVLFTDLYRCVLNNEKGHTDHGKLMTTYIERMSKANEQLLRLAELIEHASANSDVVDAASLYDEMNKQ